MIIIDDTQWHLIILDKEQYSTSRNDYSSCESWPLPSISGYEIRWVVNRVENALSCPSLPPLSASLQ